MTEIARHYEWFVIVLLVLVLMYIADRLLGISPHAFLQALAREFQQLARLQWTTGAVNAAGLVTVFLFGIILVASNDSSDLRAWISGVMDHAKAQEYAASVSATTLYLGLLFLAALSTLLTLLRDIFRG
jgi:hypothetical protein